MKAVILAGGLGTRLAEETHLRPKPMVEIGGKPILWHILKIYSSHGINDFVICCGYKGYAIKEYFSNYALHNSDVTFDLKENYTEVHRVSAEPWRITLVDTGEKTMTGGRLRKIRDHLTGTFCLTYGDGVSDVDITSLIESHKQSKKLATLTAVRPPGRFGSLKVKDSEVIEFKEKPDGEGGWINGGFFVLEPEALDLVRSDDCIWEGEPLQSLTKSKSLNAFFHEGYWQPMDTLRDKQMLERLWDEGRAPWKTW